MREKCESREFKCSDCSRFEGGKKNSCRVAEEGTAFERIFPGALKRSKGHHRQAQGGRAKVGAVSTLTVRRVLSGLQSLEGAPPAPLPPPPNSTHWSAHSLGRCRSTKFSGRATALWRPSPGACLLPEAVTLVCHGIEIPVHPEICTGTPLQRECTIAVAASLQLSPQAFEGRWEAPSSELPQCFQSMPCLWMASEGLFSANGTVQETPQGAKQIQQHGLDSQPLGNENPFHDHCSDSKWVASSLFHRHRHCCCGTSYGCRYIKKNFRDVFVQAVPKY